MSEIKSNRVYCGDVIEVLKGFDNESVHMVITSPPYNVGIKYDTHDDDMVESDYYNFTTNWIKECFRVLTADGRIAINIPCMGMKDSFAPLKFANALISCGFHLRECITWVKSHDDEGESFCGNNTAWGSWLSPSNPFCRSITEFILIAHKQAKLKRKGDVDITKEEFIEFTKNVWYMKTKYDKNHPAVFPDELPYRIMKLYTYVGDTILDPFCGSGTTLKICSKYERNWIGIDISKKYCDMAENSIGLFGTVGIMKHGQ